MAWKKKAKQRSHDEQKNNPLPRDHVCACTWPKNKSVPICKECRLNEWEIKRNA